MLTRIQTQSPIHMLFKIIIITFILGAFSTVERKKNRIKALFKAINNSYRYMLNSGGKIMKALMCLACFLIVLLFFITALQKCCLENDGDLTGKNILMTVVVWIIIIIFFYFPIGSILTLFLKTAEIIDHIINPKIAMRMMISFLLLVLLFFFSFMQESEVQENLPFMFLGLITSYILNMQILLKMVQNPYCLVEDAEQHKSGNRVLIMFSSLLILLMIIVNMYLLVLWTYYSYDNAYCCSLDGGVVTKWKLLYYTIISFTTIGYGDITPVIFESQVVAIVIAITSVICLIIFVSSILSEKKEIFKDDQDDGKEFPIEKPEKSEQR